MNTKDRSNGKEIVLLSKGKKALAEEQMLGAEAEKAIDGREDTYWSAAPYYKWWKIDLLTSHEITQIKMVTNRCDKHYSHYLIEYSEDDLNWETLVEKRDDTAASLVGEQYDIAVQARYIRVTITYYSGGEQVYISDFQVYGYEGEAAPIADIYYKVSHRKIPAVACDELSGFEKITLAAANEAKQTEVLIGSDVGSYLRFHSIDFSEAGVDQLRGSFALSNQDRNKQVTLEVRVDRLNGEKIGEIILFQQWQVWSILGSRLAHENDDLLTGIHDVYLVIAASSATQQIMIEWLSFVKKSPLPVPRSPAPLLPLPKEEFQIYFGNLHSHTSFSDGIGVPETAFDFARYEAELDFLGITEHSNLYDNFLDWDTSRKWRDIQEMSDRKTSNDCFLALIGSETTWYNQFGHMNTYNLDFFINTYETDYNDIAHYYDTLKRYPDSINQWNHPWSSGDRHLDAFEPYDSELDEVIQLIELNPRESKECGGLYYYVMALDKGWHVAPVGNQDNHHGQWGTQNTLRTAIVAERLTKEHFFDAVRQRRVYFTNALYLQLWFRINGAIMGSRIQRTDELVIDIIARYSQDTGKEISQVEIIGEHGQVLYNSEVNSKQLEKRLITPCIDRYYFVKVIQDDGNFAVSAPVWIE